MRLIDLSGNRYGRLTVISRAGYYRKEVMWHCRCDCGKEVDVVGGSLHTRLCINLWNVDEAVETPVTRRNKKHRKVKQSECA